MRPLGDEARDARKPLHPSIAADALHGSIHGCDLTPDEARAELLVYLGGDWSVSALSYKHDPAKVVYAMHGRVHLGMGRSTFREAVDAFKAEWGGAVEPWMEAAISAKLDTADVDGYAPDEAVIARVLKDGIR